MTDLVVDCSNFTGPLREGDVQCWMANGVKRVVVQAVNPPAGYPATQTVQQLHTCAVSGMPVDAYVYLWWSLPVTDILAKLGLLKGYRIGRVWLDVEDAPDAKLKVGDLVNKMQAALNFLKSWPADNQPGIYTGKWWWDAYMQGYQGFADYPLWAAQYDGNANPDVFTAFGGWSKVLMKQHAGNAVLCGIRGIDLSVMRPQPPGGATVIRVGEGMQARMDAAGDRPLFGHRWLNETDDDGQTYKVETCYGTKGLYVSSNVDGPDQWVNAGPMGGV